MKGNKRSKRNLQILSIGTLLRKNVVKTSKIYSQNAEFWGSLFWFLEFRKTLDHFGIRLKTKAFWISRKSQSVFENREKPKTFSNSEKSKRFSKSRKSVKFFRNPQKTRAFSFSGQSLKFFENLAKAKAKCCLPKKQSFLCFS